MKKIIKIASLLAVILFLIMWGHPYKIADKEKSKNYYFNLIKSEVHYVPNGNSFELGDRKLKDVDPKTFEVIDEYHAKDKNGVYFQDKFIKNADASSFVILCGDGANYFAKDKNMAYYNSSSFQGLDIASFQFAGKDCGMMIKDKNHVFSVYTDNDEYSVYGNCEILRDGNCAIPPLQYVKPEKFQELNGFYSKDGETAYYKQVPIEGSDAKSFALLSRTYAQDANKIYCDGSPMIVDKATFVVVEDGDYAKDKNSVYNFCKVMVGSIPAQFTKIYQVK